MLESLRDLHIADKTQELLADGRVLLNPQSYVQFLRESNQLIWNKFSSDAKDVLSVLPKIGSFLWEEKTIIKATMLASILVSTDILKYMVIPPNNDELRLGGVVAITYILGCGVLNPLVRPYIEANEKMMEEMRKEERDQDKPHS